MVAASGVGPRGGDKPYKMDNEDRKTAGAAEAQAEARKSNEVKSAQIGGKATGQDEPLPDSSKVTRDSGEAT